MGTKESISLVFDAHDALERNLALALDESAG
jgi:hypothetical protein